MSGKDQTFIDFISRDLRSRWDAECRDTIWIEVLRNSAVISWWSSRQAAWISFRSRRKGSSLLKTFSIESWRRFNEEFDWGRSHRDCDSCIVHSARRESCESRDDADGILTIKISISLFDEKTVMSSDSIWVINRKIVRWWSVDKGFQRVIVVKSKDVLAIFCRRTQDSCWRVVK